MTKRRIIIVLLLVVAVAGLWRAVAVEQEKRQIAQAYQKAQQLVDQLETERSRLNQELVSAHDKIEGQATELSSLQHELKEVQDRLDQTRTELTSLQQAHEVLQGQHASLLSEKQKLEAKLSDLKELRLAIHDVKRKMWNQRWAAWYAHVQQTKALDQQRLAEGNRGYLVRDGVGTLGAPQKLRVHVLEPQSQ